MARLRDDWERSPWRNFLRWLREGDDALDRAMIASLDAPAPELREEAVPEAPALPAEEPLSEKRRRRLRAIYIALSVLLCVGIIGVLVRTAGSLPSFGGAENPANNEVSRRYIEQGLQETGAVNIVAGMILDYRAFDTLGESNVLFAAACAVMLLLRALGWREGGTELPGHEPHSDIILQKISTVLVPLILLYGMYVILNGHLSPGGGFSGGAVMGAGLILCANAFGSEVTRKFFTFRTFQLVSLFALSFYALSKAYSFFTGANGLHSFITAGTPGRIFSAGLIPYLNLAVGLVVCCTMYGLYGVFRRGDV